MEKKKNDKSEEIGYFSMHFGIYPRMLYVIKGSNKNKVITDNFVGRDGRTNLIVEDDDTSTGSRMWSVRERFTGKLGFLVQLKRVNNTSELAHEATHVAFELFRDIGAVADEDNQEPFAYLVGWVTEQLLYAYRYKENKNDK